MSSNQKDISLKEIFEKIRVLWFFLLSKWKIIVLCGLLGGALGLVVSIVKTKKYKSALIFVVEEDSEASGGRGLASLASNFGLGGSSEAGIFSTSNMLELLKSRLLIERTLLAKIDSNSQSTFAQLYFERYELNENELFKNISFKINEDRSKFSRLKDSVLNVIRKVISEDQLKVSLPNEETAFILVEVENESELFTKRFPEKLIEVVSLYYVNSKTKKAQINVDVLQKQVDSVRRELYNAMTGAAAANDQVFGLNPSMNVQRVPAVRKQVDVQANSAILSELVKNLEISKMSLLNKTPLIEIIDRPIYPLEVNKLRKIWGVIIGGFLVGFLTIGVLLFKRFLKKIKES